MPASISAASSGELGAIAPTLSGFFRNACRNWRFSFIRIRSRRNRLSRLTVGSFFVCFDCHFIITTLVLAIRYGAVFPDRIFEHERRAASKTLSHCIFVQKYNNEFWTDRPVAKTTLPANIPRSSLGRCFFGRRPRLFCKSSRHLGLDKLFYLFQRQSGCLVRSGACAIGFFWE